MSWQLLISLSVLLYSVNSLLHRTLMKNELADAHAQAVAFTGLTGIFSLVIMLFRGGFQSALSLNQLPLFLLCAFFSAMGMIAAFKGFQSMEASEHTILLTSSRIWSILGAIFFLQESLSVNKFLGAAAILFGVVLAQWKKQTLKLSLGAFYVLLAAFLFASSEILSYYIIRNFDVLSFMVYGSFFVTLILISIRPQIIKKLLFYAQPKYGLNIIVTSFNDALASIFGYFAYQIGRNALQIGPLGATATIITVLMGIIFLKENDHMPQKIIGGSLAVIGSILLCQ